MRLAALATIALIMIVPCGAQANAEESRAIAAYPLTMDHVNRHFQTLIDLNRQMGHDPDLTRQLSGWNDLTVVDQIRHFESVPKAAATAKAHGISSRDQMMTGVTLMAAILVSRSIDHGTKGPGPKNQLEWTAAPPDHLKFYSDHKVEITKLQTELGQVYKERRK
jgi:hypothetical protein